MKIRTLIASTAAALATSILMMPLALAQNSAAPASAAAMQTTQPAAADMSEGEVRKIDKDSKRITLRHGEIRNLGMPGMTMVFHVKDPALLDAVKAGDRVRFSAEKINGALTVTAIEAVR